MTLSFDYGTERIEFSVVYRKRKTVSIEIEPPNEIIVIAPIGASEDKILDTVKSKAKWIVQKLFEIREVEYRRREKEFVNGESFLYLGRNHSLQIIIDDTVKTPSTKLFQGKFYVTARSKDEKEIKSSLERWYREKALEKISERAEYYKSYFDINPSCIRVKDQQKRWGSCTTKNELLFNWKCIMAPSPVLDYVVVHEMCHMIYKDHSKEFWQLLKSVLPDYENRKIWLRNNGIKYDL